MKNSVCLALLICLTACNTAAGVKKDVQIGAEKTGEVIKKGGEVVGDAMKRGGEAVQKAVE
ncbi:entericidin EcnAB [Azonexus sp.]|uniref:entericidin EcnAB n=1 Tax=Azonexus sp. TaxID=1872668 RepID=UPI0039E3822E